MNKKWLWREKLIFTLFFLLPLLPWYAWSISKVGWEETFLSTPAVTMSYKSSAKWWGVKVRNILTCSLPIHFIYSLRRWLHNLAPSISLYNGFLAFSTDTIPGFMGISTLFFFLLGLLRRENADMEIPFGKFLLLWIIAGITGCIITEPYDYVQGIVHTGMLPAVLILLVWIGMKLLKMKEGKIWRFTVMAEFSLFLWSVPLLTPFVRDANLDLKLKHHLTFLYDRVYPYRFLIILFIVFIQIGVIIWAVKSMRRNNKKERIPAG